MAHDPGPMFSPMPEVTVAAGGRVFKAFGLRATHANQNAMLVNATRSEGTETAVGLTLARLNQVRINCGKREPVNTIIVQSTKVPGP